MPKVIAARQRVTAYKTTLTHYPLRSTTMRKHKNQDNKRLEQMGADIAALVTARDGAEVEIKKLTKQEAQLRKKLARFRSVRDERAASVSELESLLRSHEQVGRYENATA